MKSMFYRTTVDIPGDARMDHALLPSDGEGIQISFKTVSRTGGGDAVYTTTQVELPLRVAKVLGGIVEALERQIPALDDYEMAYLDADALEDLAHLLTVRREEKLASQLED